MKINDNPIIGFEVHVELGTKSKMFCGCSADHFSKAPNSLTCPVCLGLPGALPVPNRKAVDWTIMIGLALNCQIATESKFDRKHYFYPDLPKGYQISQYDMPLCVNGYLETSFGKIGIERVHLEEDTGKLQHKIIDGVDVSLVDFNRSGVPLVEIVTKPDIHSTAQALEYAKKLRQIITTLGVSDCDMEKGSMRLEANISWGMDLGYKVEVKNVNSFRFIGKSIDYELNRQKKILEKGETPTQETRGWHEKSSTTKSQRVKETASDYRYFPEPDIPPMQFEQSWIDELKVGLPELPAQKAARWIKAGMREDFASQLSTDNNLVEYVDKIIKKTTNHKDFDVNQVISQIINKQIDPNKLTAEQLLDKISTEKSAKITDETQLKTWVDQAIAKHPKAVEDYKNGKDAAISMLIGMVMGISKGKADGSTVKKLIEKIRE